VTTLDCSPHHLQYKKAPVLGPFSRDLKMTDRRNPGASRGFSLPQPVPVRAFMTQMRVILATIATPLVTMTAAAAPLISGRKTSAPEHVEQNGAAHGGRKKFFAATVPTSTIGIND
jgi:hypothetical protein